jgi:hypothetical protein
VKTLLDAGAKVNENSTDAAGPKAHQRAARNSSGSKRSWDCSKSHYDAPAFCETGILLQTEGDHEYIATRVCHRSRIADFSASGAAIQ